MKAKDNSLPSVRHTHLRSRLLIPFVISNLMMISMALFTINYFENVREQDYYKKKKVDVINTYNSVITENSELQIAVIEMIKSNPRVTEAWMNKDLLSLLSVSEPMFNYMQEQHGITHFYFHEPDQTIFLRLHNKDRWGDRNERITMQKAVQTGRTVNGLEFGAKGALVLRTIYPWWIDNKLVGYIEIGEELDRLLEKVSRVSTVELALIIDKKTRNAIRNTIPMEPMKSVYNIDSHDRDFIGLYYTSRFLAEAIQDKFKTLNQLTSDTFDQLNLNRQHFILTSFPITNVVDDVQAYIIFSNDITEFLKAEDALLKLVATIIVAAMFLMMLFFYYYSGRLQIYLSSIYDKLAVQIDARIDSEKKLEAYSRELEDEVMLRTKELRQANEELEKDIELRKKTEEEFRLSENKYRTLFEKTPEATLLIDNNNFVDCNDATVKMLRYSSKEELLQTHPSELSPPKQPDGRDSWEKAEEMMQMAFRHGSHRFEWDHKRANGEVFPVEVLLTSIPMGDRQVLYTVWRDITDRKKDEETIRQQAFYDSLTGLPNRVLLRDRLQQAVIHANRYKNLGAVMFLDLDQFKKINDSLGHSIGDALLIEVSNRILECLREGDTAARLGGDEFVVLLPDLPAHENVYNYAEKVAEKIKTTINHVYQIDQYELKISTSIGISIFAGKNEKIDDILRHADTAMYRAKEDGRNAIRFFLPSMQAEVVKRLTLEKELAESFEQEKLDIHYQPQCSVHHKLFGVESLLRWEHPQRGFISPLELIAVAEEIGLIIPLSNWILKKAMQDIGLLMSENPEQGPIRLSINLSPFQFLQDDFILSIKKALIDTGFSPELLTLEITENVIINNIDDTIAKCYQLRELGIHISLDDFGTGYSSLSYLKQLPINELKIDRSFVRDIETDRNDAMLVESIISLAKHFGLEIVAEGVETQEQLNFLMQLECNAYQGFYFSKPLALDKLDSLYKQNGCQPSAGLTSNQ